MIVCLDSGNTLIKWGVHDGSAWLAQGAVAHADVAQAATGGWTGITDKYWMSTLIPEPGTPFTAVTSYIVSTTHQANFITRRR